MMPEQYGTYRTSSVIESTKDKVEVGSEVAPTEVGMLSNYGMDAKEISRLALEREKKNQSQNSKLME